MCFGITSSWGCNQVKPGVTIIYKNQPNKYANYNFNLTTIFLHAIYHALEFFSANTWFFHEMVCTIVEILNSCSYLLVTK